ncbi:hypothetical protein F7Q92_19850 [Ideonella dechloratans]|uniref:Uncharacterized protein n=1 Tax=Ideonella dechloratans TaxID=36863 RepID=A0A643F6H5_IDEDE|nr:hypothetical protein [Ideonella dechloratans]KAB0574238.1 hypothetical protein F7Q92_19850 [Ideonella dechloratans]UFU10642.1 hypothetical protein LRM40_02825 [Ideonella dechloratans]
MFPHRTLLRAATPEQLLGAAQPDRGLRHLVARGLRTLALALARAARGVAPRPLARQHRGLPPPADLPLVEYHGQAGAPEGALYVKGEFIGRLEVDRL